MGCTLSAEAEDGQDVEVDCSGDEGVRPWLTTSRRAAGQPPHRLPQPIALALTTERTSLESRADPRLRLRRDGVRRGVPALPGDLVASHRRRPARRGDRPPGPPARLAGEHRAPLGRPELPPAGPQGPGHASIRRRPTRSSAPRPCCGSGSGPPWRSVPTAPARRGTPATPASTPSAVVAELLAGVQPIGAGRAGRREAVQRRPS